MSELLHIEGTVENVLYRNETNGYIVLDLNASGEPVTVTGELGDIEEGECLSLYGEYVTHPRFGPQFQVENCERKLPNTTDSIRRYLESGVIKGIGKVLAGKIVDTFGARTLAVMENEPMRLMEVRGMSQRKCEEVAEAAKHIFQLRGVISYFDGYGIKSRYAMRAYRIWGDKCRDMIANNPYLLCSEEVGMSFKNVESYAHDLRIPRDAQCRVGAGIIHLLRHNLSMGHTCLPLDRLCPTAVNFLEINESAFYEAYNNELKEETIVEYRKSGSEREFVYLKEYYEAEHYATERIGVMRDFGIRDNSDFENMIAETEKSSGMAYADLQKQAIRAALSRGLLILTGGPGTGKTTTLNAIISCFEKQGNRVMIAAPTGRAAKRVSDLTGYEAKTIHRLLEVQFDPSGQQKFIHNEENPLACDVLVVDEMSMVDVLLFSNLLRALRLGCKMILVGDSDQLPSVGAGNLLQHLIVSGCMPVVALREIFRQAQQSVIITNAHKIVRGEMPDLLVKNNDFFFFHRTDFQPAAELLIDLVCRRLPNAPQYRFSPTKDIQVICPSRRGVLGVIELNKALQARLNPPEAGKAQVKSTLYEFRDGDKVMQTKNNYDITWTKDGENGQGIFNGDIGHIRSINRRRGEAVIDFDGRITVYPVMLMEQLELAYAITVHKSQGSEFEAVVMPLLGKFEKLSYRNLLYTAVTRAKRLLVIVGTPQKVEQMVMNNRRTNRYSCLRDMLERSLTAAEPSHANNTDTNNTDENDMDELPS
ncbi:MAG: ATP-dependent RecD-like DNA helicase [Oscillospiraceae bacterium]|nr:ATP-dependent RecD-like DNA helicase [Oscillospiraceae bacterium]